MHIVISGSDDPHIPYVQRHLDEPLQLIDARDILKDACSFRIQNGTTEILKSGRQLREVQSVWYRRVMLVQESELPVADDHRPYAYKAIRSFNKLLFTQFADAFWLPDFYADEKANDKLWQLQTAAHVGFNIPDTVFTASGDEALAFIRSQAAVIAKPQHASIYRQDGKDYVFYTSYVDERTDFSGLHLAPAILQAAVEVNTELRVTVVGDKVFAASVVTPKNSVTHIRDWRAADMDEEVTVTAFDLPKGVAKKCVKVVQELGLHYGAIDIIVDSKGKYWFLENNPNGAWAFIEAATELPIGKAIAELLTHGK